MTKGDKNDFEREEGGEMIRLGIRTRQKNEKI